MPNYDKILPVTAVKQKLLEIIDNLDGTIAITKNGYAAGVLMSVDEYEGLIETIEILSDPEAMKRLRQSKREMEEGKLTPHDEVWEQL